MGGDASDGHGSSAGGNGLTTTVSEMSNGDGLARPVCVLVAHDHPVFRSSVVRALGLVPNVEVAGEADGGVGACRAVLTLMPDVVLIHLSMPGMDGLDATRRIRRTSPSTSVVIIAAFDGPALERSAIQAGAAGVVAKGAPLEDVVGVILDAAAGPVLKPPVERTEPFARPPDASAGVAGEARPPRRHAAHPRPGARTAREHGPRTTGRTRPRRR
jgi:DNA-binding NarL/FixJ family response regulator